MSDLNKIIKDITVNKLLSPSDNLDISSNGLVLRKDFAINLNLITSELVDTAMSLFRPFRFTESRICRIVGGELVYRINLIEHSFLKGDIVIIKQGSLCEIISMSNDCKMEVIAFSYETIKLNAENQNRVLWKAEPKESDWNEIGSFYLLIYNIARHEPFRTEVVKKMLGALVENILSVVDLVEKKKNSEPKSRQVELFNKFINLLNSNLFGKQDIAFYADKMCITPHYLSRVVSKASGQSVMQWVNKSVILEAKIKLKNSDLTIAEIAESLNFETFSFFSRFFKRETGITPTEYRNS